ncbi:hypothetical protein M3N55_04730 [Roseibaca sp. V10]|uniref:Uncharacterized protein n=1 Tax=Roseinatronobacter domitianus TaxID=2940293 RepID=A0ABT0LZI9_9RHOB|nr:hypothetical protein [Roseibaca domitiana]MCL1628027.1 hypothetical protein [Roseibaca domitiana]
MSVSVVPVLTSDAQADDFLDQDLSTLDFAQFKPAWFKTPKPKPKPQPQT